MEKGYHFFALLHRMKYIDRWSLMRNTQKENLSEHTLDVCFITHALVTINHLDFKGDADLEKALLLALYHDVPEILTGDLPTPVKYYNEKIKSSYDEIEAFAAQRLLSHLPEDFREKYAPWFEGLPCYEQKLVKAADKLSALCKCITELRTGNREFAQSYHSCLAYLEGMGLPEVTRFQEEFIPSFSLSLDEMEGAALDASHTSPSQSQEE